MHDPLATLCSFIFSKFSVLSGGEPGSSATSLPGPFMKIRNEVGIFSCSKVGQLGNWLINKFWERHYGHGQHY